jgi:hypothetical protein
MLWEGSSERWKLLNLADSEEQWDFYFKCALSLFLFHTLHIQNGLGGGERF